jgi:hypothetical protein
VALFIPAVRPEDISHDSERLVYEGLQALPQGYVVLHSFPWVRPARDLIHEPLREGEADFVVLHPERGLLILEVKGGVPELRERTWFRGGREMRDPFDQARRNRYALLDAIEARTHRHVSRGLLTHGDVVVFPHCRYEGPLPLNTDERILLDARDIEALAPRIEAAFAAWRRHETRLSIRQFSELQDALLPKLRLMRCSSSEVASESRRIVQITLDQHATLAGLLANQRVLVEGTAGSGKTLLALEFALTLTANGQRVLLLCFNRNLAEWLQDQMAGDPRRKAAGGKCEIATFHSFAFALARRAGVEFEVPTEDPQLFWDYEVPLILEQAIEVLATRGAPLSFDAVVVDEAQDFATDWWVTIESLTRNGRDGNLYAFLDLNQSVRGTAVLPSVGFQTRFRLTTNCRNTKSIARSGAALAGVEATLLPGSPEGEEPATRRARSEAADAGIVLAEVRRLLSQGVLAGQIALIGPSAHDKGALQGHGEVEGIPLITDAAEWRRGGGILVTTARSFKGLEADVVVLYGLACFGPAFTPTDLYVAWTRAKHRLLAVCHGDEVRSAIEVALADSRPTGQS